MLFDDIESDMLMVDAKEFPSFAHAQVAVTNDVYEHLGRPKIFLFCPTGKSGLRHFMRNTKIPQISSNSVNVAYNLEYECFMWCVLQSIVLLELILA